jgi:hypothetical protein
VSASTRQASGEGTRPLLISARQSSEEARKARSIAKHANVLLNSNLTNVHRSETRFCSIQPICYKGIYMPTNVAALALNTTIA